MNVVFLSPHFPPQFWLFVKALRARGATVLGIGDVPGHELSPELGRELSAWYQVPDLHDYEATLRAVGFLIHRHGRIDHVESLNEHWLELEARLREDFNVPGPRPAELHRMRSKMGMKELFSAGNIPCSIGERIESPAQVRAFVARHGLPVVFKPDVGVGAARTFKATTPAQVEKAIAENLSGYLVEKFEPGTLTSFDGITDKEGRIVFCTSHLFSAGIMDIVNERRTMFYWSRREIPQGLEEVGRRAVKAFDVKGRFFHFEFFEDDGAYRALEVNLRPPGGYTTDLMNYTADIDVYDLWARVLTGDDVSNFQYDRRFHVAHVGRRRDVSYEVSHEEAVRRLGNRLLIERPMPPVLSGAMGEHMYLIRERDEAQLLDTVRMLSR